MLIKYGKILSIRNIYTYGSAILKKHKSLIKSCKQSKLLCQSQPERTLHQDVKIKKRYT